MRLKYEAPRHHRLLEAGETIRGGDEFDVPDDRALELLTSPHVRVSAVDDPEPLLDPDPDPAPDAALEPNQEEDG